MQSNKKPDLGGSAPVLHGKAGLLVGLVQYKPKAEQHQAQPPGVYATRCQTAHTQQSTAGLQAKARSGKH